ncbi:MAG: DNA-binding response regulator [Deltaproteobacteria bacterium]|nr:MAG: DNA-binding response regulator [Deltaproteobacteria bacterium]
MRVLIIEDEMSASKRLENMLKKIDPKMEILGVLDSIDDTVNWLTSNKDPDIIFADIQLSDGVCFDIFKQVQTKSAVIFTTAYDEYAVEAFKVNSIDYLLKPINPEALSRSIEKFHTLKRTYAESDKKRFESLFSMLDQAGKDYKSRFLVKTGQNMKIVSTEEIAYFLIETQLVFLITKQNNRFLIEQTLDELEKRLDPKLFFRINRQMIISLDSVRTIHPYFNSRLKLDVTPERESEILVSRMKVNDFKKWIDQ